jgi:hypothetical protein
MVLLAAAAALAILPPIPHPVSASIQATATIRVVQGVLLKLDGTPNADAPGPHSAMLRSSDGTTQTVKLIEFQ